MEQRKYVRRQLFYDVMEEVWVCEFCGTECDDQSLRSWSSCCSEFDLHCLIDEIANLGERALNCIPCADPGDRDWYYSELADAYYNALMKIMKICTAAKENL